MISGNRNRRPVVALIAASFLMLALGLTHRILAARLLAPISMTPIDPAALNGFPTQIGDWKGEDVPLDETIPPKIGADACINRRYSRRSGLESVSLFIAASGITGTLVGDAPEACNVYAGYTLTDQRSIDLALNDRTKLPCRVLQFSRGGSLASENKTVLYYYMADGQFCGNRLQSRLRVRRGPSMVNCVAQVQIVASSTDTRTADSTTRIVSDFAVDSASTIAELLEHVEKDRSTGESGKASEGI